MTETVDKQAEPSEDALRKYYEENKKNYQVPESILAQQIRVKTRDEAAVVLKELKAGTSFAELARSALV